MFLGKYGVARHIYIPIIKRAVVDFAVSADWTPSAGDVKISKDGGAAANVTNLPTAITMGNTAMWDFSLTTTEMQAAQVVVMVADAATKAVEDQSFVVETYGNASAQHAFDLGTASTAQTGDNFARLGAPAGASHAADVAAVKVDTAAVKVQTDKLTFTGANKVDASVRDWVGDAIPARNVTGVPIVDTKYVTGTLQTARDIGGTLGAAGAGLTAIPTIATVTTLTNLPAITSNWLTAAGIAASALNGKGDWNIGKTGYALSAAGVQAIWDALTSALTTVGSVGKLLVTNIDAAISSRLATSGYTAPDNADIVLIKAKTDNLPASPAAVGSAMTLTSGERDSVSDALLDRTAGVETGLTLRQWLRAGAAALFGKANGLSGTTVHYRDTNDTKNRITATVDADGDRSSVTLDVS